MPRLQEPPIAPGLDPTVAQPAGWSRGAAEPIRLYGWDGRSETWYGPTELGRRSIADRRLLQALRSVPGSSWFGPVNCRTLGQPAVRFFSLVHDLSDCAMAAIYCGESKAGPAEILAVLPAERRSRLREDFAFEFVAFARFLGSLSAGAELQVHDAIASAIAEEVDSATVVFSISTGLLPSDLELSLSYCVEKVAVTVRHWLGRVQSPGALASHADRRTCAGAKTCRPVPHMMQQ